MSNIAYNQLSTNMQTNSTTISTFFGDLSITQPVLTELIESPIVQRLKKIHQSGIAAYPLHDKRYTRYGHSLGVLALLDRFGANLEEQIAGLLHDASHTVFSHVGDVIFKHSDKNSSYQDDIHAWYLEQSHVQKILNKYNIKLADIIHKNGNHNMLEQDLPNICADRLDYNLQTAYQSKLMNRQEIETLLDELRFENGQWFFINTKYAYLLGKTSLYLTMNQWAAPYNGVIYHWAGQAINRALEIKLITRDEIHFGTDDVVFDKLINSDDKFISDCMRRIMSYKQSYRLSDAHDYDIHLAPKFRGINPWIQTDNGLQRLTDLDSNFAQEYERVKSVLDDGWYIKFI